MNGSDEEDEERKERVEMASSWRRMEEMKKDWKRMDWFTGTFKTLLTGPGNPR